MISHEFMVDFKGLKVKILPAWNPEFAKVAWRTPRDERSGLHE